MGSGIRCGYPTMATCGSISSFLSSLAIPRDMTNFVQCPILVWCVRGAMGQVVSQVFFRVLYNTVGEVHCAMCSTLLEMVLPVLGIGMLVVLDCPGRWEPIRWCAAHCWCRCLPVWLPQGTVSIAVSVQVQWVKCPWECWCLPLWSYHPSIGDVSSGPVPVRCGC
jgi:hypothetical protein